MTAPVWQRIITPLLIAVALGLTLLWPGDATWHTDEPRLLAEAWHANHDGEFVRGGLWGNFGIRYGPLPSWIYQALLLLTHDPETLLLLRALLCAGTTAAALLWLARELRLPAWFAAAVLAAPYVVQYHRLIWDASFAVPLSALTLAAFAAFLRTGSRKTLVLCVAGALLLPTIHPQSLPLTLPVLGWLTWKQRPAVRRAWKPLTTLALVLLGTHALWLGEAIGGFVQNLSGSVKHGYPNGASHAACALAPLLGGNLIGGLGCTAQVEGAPAIRWGLVIVYPLVWLGIVFALRRWRGEQTPREIVGVVAVTGLAVQAALFGLLRIPAGPQYFFGTFALHVLLAWLAVDELAILGAAYGASAVIVSTSLALTIHQRGYDPALDWPTLRNQVAISRTLNGFTDRDAHTDVEFFQKHPQSLRALRLLLPPAPGQPQRASGRLLITRISGEVELREPAERPAGELMDITPLPKGWQPAASAQ